MTPIAVLLQALKKSWLSGIFITEHGKDLSYCHGSCTTPNTRNNGNAVK